MTEGNETAGKKTAKITTNQTVPKTAADTKAGKASVTDGSEGTVKRTVAEKEAAAKKATDKAAEQVKQSTVKQTTSQPKQPTVQQPVSQPKQSTTSQSKQPTVDQLAKQSAAQGDGHKASNTLNEMPKNTPVIITEGKEGTVDRSEREKQEALKKAQVNVTVPQAKKASGQENNAKIQSPTGSSRPKNNVDGTRIITDGREELTGGRKVTDTEEKTRLLQEAEEKVQTAANDLFSSYNTYCWAVEHGVLN